MPTLYSVLRTTIVGIFDNRTSTSTSTRTGPGLSHGKRAVKENVVSQLQHRPIVRHVFQTAAHQ
jgi:hypothetical protein